MHCNAVYSFELLPPRKELENLTVLDEPHAYRVCLALGEIDITTVDVEVEPHRITIAFRELAALGGTSKHHTVDVHDPIRRHHTTMSTSAGKLVIAAAKAPGWDEHRWRERVQFDTRASAGSV